jgi:hypothetical protein
VTRFNEDEKKLCRSRASENRSVQDPKHFILGYRWLDAITKWKPGHALRTIVGMDYCERLNMLRVVAFSVAWMIPYIPEDCVLIGEPTKGATDDNTKFRVRP